MNMRNLSITLLLSAAIASPGAAQDLTGTWEISTQGGRGGPQTMTLVVIQDGQGLTGTLTRTLPSRGGRGGGAMESDVENGMIEGKNFSFQVTLSFGGNSFTQSFSGAIDGGSMEGTIEGGRGQGRPFSGERKN
ncbi:MAG: hypothetical protein MK243_02530 [Gemmatimonadetes bacterium]|nr:hypothetical protein [Gemmatimonadota bacterium]